MNVTVHLIDAYGQAAEIERPETDAGILRMVADWLDRCDVAFDADTGTGPPCGDPSLPSFQEDLRRIANGLAT